MSANDIFNDPYVSSIISSYIPKGTTTVYRGRKYMQFDDVKGINLLWCYLRKNNYYYLRDYPMKDNHIDKFYRHKLYDIGVPVEYVHSEHCYECISHDPSRYEYYERRHITWQYYLVFVFQYIMSILIILNNIIFFPILYPIFICMLYKDGHLVHESEFGFGYSSNDYPNIYNYPEFTRQLLFKYIFKRTYVRREWYI